MCKGFDEDVEKISGEEFHKQIYTKRVWYNICICPHLSILFMFYRIYRGLIVDLTILFWLGFMVVLVI